MRPRHQSSESKRLASLKLQTFERLSGRVGARVSAWSNRFLQNLCDAVIKSFEHHQSLRDLQCVGAMEIVTPETSQFSLHCLFSPKSQMYTSSRIILGQATGEDDKLDINAVMNKFSSNIYQSSILAKMKQSRINCPRRSELGW
ncbi:hypothetical protein Bca4012_058311 [Brassica carinata]